MTSKTEMNNYSTLLSCRGLKKSYKDIKAVKSLSLDIRRGEIFGFLGPNGAGKTTTLKMICGLLKPDGGEIIYQGREIKKADDWWKNDIGYCPQELVLWEQLTCFEQLVFLASLYDIKKNAAVQRAQHLIKVLGLGEKKNRLARKLSGGLKRRLNIALALIHDPQVLILDEPQAGLDPQSRIMVREYIRSMAGKKTVILTTHEMNEVDQIADRIGIIDRGELLVLDTAHNLKKNLGEGELLTVVVNIREADKLIKIKRNLAAKKIQTRIYNNELWVVKKDIFRILQLILELFKKEKLEISDLTIRNKTLEDVFINLTGRRLRE